MPVFSTRCRSHLKDTNLSERSTVQSLLSTYPAHHQLNTIFWYHSQLSGAGKLWCHGAICSVKRKLHLFSIPIDFFFLIYLLNHFSSTHLSCHATYKHSISNLYRSYIDLLSAIMGLHWSSIVYILHVYRAGKQTTHSHVQHAVTGCTWLISKITWLWSVKVDKIVIVFPFQLL